MHALAKGNQKGSMPVPSCVRRYTHTTGQDLAFLMLLSFEQRNKAAAAVLAAAAAQACEVASPVQYRIRGGAR